MKFLKLVSGLLACAAVAGACMTRTLAAEEPVFSTVAYLTEEQAASRVAFYCGGSKSEALEKVRDSMSVKSNVNLLRSSPAYIFGQIDVGGGNLMELGAIGAVGRVDGKLRYLGIAGTYARPVNPNMRWTPSGAAAAVISDNTDLRLSAGGKVSVDVSSGDIMADALVAEGFRPGAGPLTYEKDVALSFAYPIREGTFLTESDITDAYAAVLDYYQQSRYAEHRLSDFRRVGIEIKTPVGLTVSGKKAFFDWIAQAGGNQPVETTAEKYYQSLDNGVPAADCLFTIDRVSIDGSRMRFKVSLAMGSAFTALEGCTIEKGADGWKPVGEPEGVKMT